jgi:site-specific DNA-methyltransferase (adenine-specific)
MPHMLRVIHGDNLEALRAMPSSSVRLVYIDPPFNTGRRRTHARLATVRDAHGDRIGFGGARYRTDAGERRGYDDAFDDLPAFLAPRLEEARRVLTDDGSIYFHIDPRESHYCKVLLDGIFGRDAFLNEIVWAYDFGARTKARWPAKHDVIFWYAKDPRRYVFNHDAIDRIPYMAPGLVGPEKAARGKTPTDVWWHTIVGTSSHERTGYPTQKPLGILRRIVLASSDAGDTLMDFFAGSGSFGAAAAELGRDAILVDSNPQAIEVMRTRFKGLPDVTFDLEKRQSAAHRAVQGKR